MSGNANHDFAMMMAEHHQGSIDMSEITVKSAKDTKIESHAQNILDKQSKEQQKLRAHPKSGSEPSHESHKQASDSAASSAGGFSNEMKKAMDRMESEMHSMKMTDEIDHDFATMMIPHHQSAIEMSDAILKYGTDREIKGIAEKIKSDFEKEIGQLKSWLQNHGK